MRLFSLLTLVFFLFLGISCSKDKIVNSRYYQYTLNPSYTGSHPNNGLGLNVYMLDNSSSTLQFQVEAKSLISGKNYNLYIYEYDPSQAYGYSAEPIISLGAVNTTYGLVTESGVKSFTEFTSNFKGYLVMPDPDNVQRDTTSLLIFGKIGSDW